MAKFTVQGSGTSFFVLRDGKIVQGPFTSAGRAEDVRDELIRVAKRRPRACLTCKAEFISDGAHNRMCDPCRNRGSDMGMVA